MPDVPQPGDSDRTQRRNRQRAASMAGHPANAPIFTAAQLAMRRVTPAGEQSPLQTAARPFGAPIGGPGAAQQQQQQQPANPPHPQTGWPSSQHTLQDGVGPQFTRPGTGMGHFVNRNANGLQFNKPAVLNTVKKGMDAYSTARYFSHAGFGEAIRYTLGMQPTPSHMNDWIRARHNTDVIDKRPPALHVEQANLSW